MCSKPMPTPALMYVLNYTPATDPARALEVAARALAGGVNWITLRVRDLPARFALDCALELRRLTRETNAWLGVNPYPALAEWCSADALHLPEDAPPYTPPIPMQLGRSVHSVEAAVHAQAEGCHYLLVGTIYPTPSHPHKTPEGLERLRAVRQAVSTPLIAIGGITPERVTECLQAGAQGVAVISGIADAENPQIAATRYWAALHDAAT
ncbi:MAG: putative thiamine-phosphate synthase [Fimbriimonadales bacterium]|nr:MAG: putative thiamine-phosphate synthase [Fimbriimonadales bacterium]